MTGGLEVASDRLLELMQKGVTVAQVARVTRAFTDAGILVHAYLMYGFPTETEQETVDALERVRQLFAEGCIQSAFWHRFAATAWSPIGAQPDRYGIRVLRPPVDVRAQRGALRGSHRHRPRLGWDAGCARRSTTTCTASAWSWTCRTWFEPAPGAPRRRRRPTCPPDLIANALRIAAN